MALLPLRTPLRIGLPAGIFVLCMGVGAVWPDAVGEPLPVIPADRTLATDEAYTSSRACRACHPDAYESWAHSYHRTMTQPASTQAIVAPWQGEVSANGMTWRLLRDGDRFLVDAPAPGTTGERAADRVTLPIVMTTGSHHMQLYWVPLPWAEGQPEPAGAAAYKQHCGGCHASGGDASELVEAGLTPPDVQAGLKRAGHPAISASEGEQRRAQQWLARVQVRGRLQQFPFAWFIREQRWVHEEHTFLQPPEPLPEHAQWEQTWSEACDQCHSVGPKAEWTADGAPTRAQVAELGIACEACHGPARAHADAMRDPVARYTAHLSDGPAPHIVNPARLSPDRSIAVCAQCHGELVRNEEHGTSFPVGQTLEPWARVIPYIEAPPYPEWLQPTVDDDPLLMASAFWRDGTIRVAGRDANGVLASACAEGGLTCITCHDLHGGSRDDQLRPGMRGDAACVDCHPAEAAAGSAHHHHAEGSAGAECMNCHMPHTTLGLLTAMRAHRIDSPSAMRTHTTGRPDACTLCHVDKPLTWAADHLHDWYGHDKPDLVGESRSYAVDRFLRGDAAQRAVYAWHLGWEPAMQASGRDWMPGILASNLEDPYSAVRAITAASLRRHPGFEDLDYDFTGSAEHQRAVREQVREQWRPDAPAHRPEVMLDDDGVDEGLIELLQTVRDPRPVVVSE